ncbi:Uncharacterized conserved protein [Streptomyces sp. 3213]|nr:Uncharacterized conserved protein [Streptomyces sp. 3213] [Streptomyces sp. 3213.3]
MRIQAPRPLTVLEIMPGGTDGMSLDLMRRDRAADPGINELLIVASLQAAHKLGITRVSLVEDPKEPLSYDSEWIVLIDDCVDGVTGTPDDVFTELKLGMADMGGMDMSDTGGTEGMDMGDSASSDGMAKKFRLMGAASKLLGGDAGDVKYPHHLVNGRVATDPDVHTGKPGERVRLRIINAGSDTAYRVALGDHRLTLTHTDGFPVRHQDVDAPLVGVGERYDVLVTLGDGVFPLVALAEGKNANALALLPTGSGSVPKATVRPKELDGMIMTASQLRAADDVRLESAKTDVTHQIKLTGNMMK